MGHRIAILGHPDGWYVRDLRRAALSESIEVVSFRDLSVRSDGLASMQVESNLAIEKEKTSEAPIRRNLGGDRSDFDSVLVRTMPLGSLEQMIFRMNVLHAIERSGTPVLNSPRSLEIAIDKWLTLDFLRSSGLPTPKTYCSQTRSDAMIAFEALGRDCVVKPIFGGEGRGLIRVTDPDIAWRVFGAIEQTAGILYLQEYLEHPGYDLRLLVIGEEIHSIKRHSHGDWRTNVSRGGSATPHLATDEQRELAFQATQILGGSIMGVDILPTLDGRMVLLEVNAVPGWRGTAQALQIDIARRVLDFISS